MARMIGVRPIVWGDGYETMYRLSKPLADCAPDWRTVFVRNEAGAGRQTVMRGRAYERSDGSWAPVPTGSWIACFSPLSARDLATCNAEIAAVHGNWSA